LVKGSYDNGAKVTLPDDKWPKNKGYALGVQLVKSLSLTATRDMILGEMVNLPKVKLS